MNVGRVLAPALFVVLTFIMKTIMVFIYLKRERKNSMKQEKLAKIISLIGVAAGILVIVLGIVVMSSYSGSWSDTSTSFGADFYTYSYKATARAGNNIDEVGDMLQQALGFILIAMGLFDSCYFGLKFAAIPTEPKANLEENSSVEIPAEPVE
jgi:hypothetical protein